MPGIYIPEGIVPGIKKIFMRVSGINIPEQIFLIMPGMYIPEGIYVPGIKYSYPG